MANSETRKHVIVTPEAHRRAKVAAAKTEMSMKLWVSELITRETNETQPHQTEKGDQ